MVTLDRIDYLLFLMAVGKI